MHQIPLPLLSVVLEDDQEAKENPQPSGKMAGLEDAPLRQLRVGIANGNWHGGNVGKTCLQCGSAFSVIPSRKNKAVCCSLPCWNEYQKNGSNDPNTRHKSRRGIRTKTPIFRWCLFCLKVMTLRPASPRIYCSSVCAYSAKNGIGNRNFTKRQVRFCPQCKTPLSRDSNAIHCSMRCGRKHRVGPLAPAWKGGLVSGSMKVRLSREYKQWRTGVFERDHFTCFDCGIAGGKLAAHHIIPFSANESLRLELKNGITLCWPCHRKIHFKEAIHAERYAKHTGLEISSFKEGGAWQIDQVYP